MFPTQSNRLLICVPAVLLLLVACGGGGSGPATPSSSSQPVAIVQGPATLSTGDVKGFTATVGGVPSTAVTWSVVEPGGGSITSAGVYTAPAAPGTYTIKSTSQMDPNRSATLTVTVVALPVIATFRSSSPDVWPTLGATLSAVFQGGNGSIAPGVGAVSSGQAVPVAPTTDTSYTLTVTNAAGATTTSVVSLTYQTKAPKITELKVTPGKVLDFGPNVTFSWALGEGPATSVSFNGIDVAGLNQWTFKPSRRNPVGLTARNPIGSHTLAGTIVVRGLEPFVGSGGGRGQVDGPRAQARIGSPGFPVRDAAGNIYIPDQATHVIRKISPDGLVTTLAGVPFVPGSEDGSGSGARFRSPQGVGVDATGNLILTDRSQRIRRVSQDGVVSFVAGQHNTVGSPGDGQGGDAVFSNPTGIAVGPSGDSYVVQDGAIRKITPGGLVTTLAGNPDGRGLVDGVGAGAQIGRAPRGVALDASLNRLYFADQSLHALRCLDLGTREVRTLAGNGTAGHQDGSIAEARLSGPCGVALDGQGRVVFADQNSSTVRRYDPGTGQVSTLAGLPDVLGSKDGPVAQAELYNPVGVLVQPDGAILVLESGSGLIRQVHQGVVTTFLGQPREFGPVDGVLSQARFKYPRGLVADAQGNLYTADGMGFTVRRIAPDGTVTTLAGAPGEQGYVDGVGSAARFGRLNNYALALDDQQNLYLTDFDGHTLRKVAANGSVTTLAGSPGEMGSADGVGSEARFRQPMSVVKDSSGNLFVVDYGNHTIRKVTPAGVVTTFAGAATKSGDADGVGGNARFRFPMGLAIDEANNLYVSEPADRRIRKVAPDGTVSTFFGGSKRGPGKPLGLWAGASGSLYVVDAEGYRILKIMSDGTLATLAGTQSEFGTEGSALPGRLDGPESLFRAANGDLFVTQPGGIFQVTLPEALPD